MNRVYNRKDLGDFGERLAIRFLVSRGYKEIDKNFRLRIGEVDLIFIDPDGFVVFVEVKTLRKSGFVTQETFNTTLAEKVNHLKIFKIKKVALFYLARNMLHTKQWRIDVVGIYIDSQRRVFINHIKNVGD